MNLEVVEDASTGSAWQNLELRTGRMSFWTRFRIASNKWVVEMNLKVVEDASTGSAWQNLEVLKLENVILNLFKNRIK